MKKLLIVILFCFCVIACGKKSQGTGNINKKNRIPNVQLETKTTEDEIKEMVNIWNKASSNGDFDTLEKIRKLLLFQKIKKVCLIRFY